MPIGVSLSTFYYMCINLLLHAKTDICMEQQLKIHTQNLACWQLNKYRWKQKLFRKSKRERQVNLWSTSWITWNRTGYIFKSMRRQCRNSAGQLADMNKNNKG